MTYDLCLMSHLMFDVICSHGFGLCLAFGIKTYDFVTRADALSWVDMSFFTHSYYISGTSTPNSGHVSELNIYGKSSYFMESIAMFGTHHLMRCISLVSNPRIEYKSEFSNLV